MILFGAVQSSSAFNLKPWGRRSKGFLLGLSLNDRTTLYSYWYYWIWQSQSHKALGRSTLISRCEIALALEWNAFGVRFRIYEAHRVWEIVIIIVGSKDISSATLVSSGSTFRCNAIWENFCDASVFLVRKLGGYLFLVGLPLSLSPYPLIPNNAACNLHLPKRKMRGPSLRVPIHMVAR